MLAEHVSVLTVLRHGTGTNPVAPPDLKGSPASEEQPLERRICHEDTRRLIIDARVEELLLPRKAVVLEEALPDDQPIVHVEMQQATCGLVCSEKIFHTNVSPRGMGWKSLESMTGEHFLDESHLSPIAQQIEVCQAGQTCGYVFVALEMAVTDTFLSQSIEKTGRSRKGRHQTSMPRVFEQSGCRG